MAALKRHSPYMTMARLIWFPMSVNESGRIYPTRSRPLYFFWILAQVSRKVTVRLKTGLPGSLSTGSTLK